MRKRFAVLLAIASVAALLGALAPARSSAAPPSVAPATFGMRPSGGFLKAGRLAQYEGALDGQVNWYVGFAGRKTPQAMRSAVFGQVRGGSAVLPTVADRMNLVMTVPLAFGKGSAKTQSGRTKIRAKLLETARGEWDADYRAVATSLIEGGYPDAVIRLGHEFTGSWFPWSAQGNSDAFISAYRHVHGVLRSMSPDFRFEWNSSKNTFVEYGPPAYPGDAYVDVVGLDVYYRPSRGGKTMAEGAWQGSYRGALSAHQEFARAHGKPVAYSEWANGGVDEPAFIQNMYNWFESLPRSGPGSLAYHSYFNVDDSYYNLDSFPRSKRRYLELFGGHGSAGAPSPADLFGPQPPSGGSGGPTINAPARINAVRDRQITVNIDAEADSFKWWKVSGPGRIAWGDRQVEDVRAAFKAKGTYWIGVRADRNGATVRAKIKVVVS